MPSSGNNDYMQWYESWFGTTYYDLLYEHRDAAEAKRFVAGLLARIYLMPSFRILDLACGQGRHAAEFHVKGFEVTGLDLSEKNILAAGQRESEGLVFAVHDMRKPWKENHFDLIVNLFTSFGYFENKQDDMRVLHSVHQCLKTRGYFVIDFMNSILFKNQFKPFEKTVKNGVKFSITRSFEGDRFLKKITVRDNGKEFIFYEKVRALTLRDFQSYFKKAGLGIEQVFGDYDFRAYNEKKSERIIIIARKES